MEFSGEELERDLLEGPRSVLLFGPPITGKTQSLVTLLRGGWGPLHLHDFDMKCQSLLREAKKEGLLNQVKVFRYGSPKSGAVQKNQYTKRDGSAFLEFLRVHNAYFDQVEKDKRTGFFKWKDPETAPRVIVYDSLTVLNSIILEYVLDSVGHDLGAPRTDARSDYGKQMGKLLEVIRSSKTLPALVIWLAHEKMDKDEQLGQFIVTPSATGQLSVQLAREFNTVFYSRVSRKGQTFSYEWVTKPLGYVHAAGTTDQSDLPSVIEQDWTKVLGVRG